MMLFFAKFYYTFKPMKHSIALCFSFICLFLFLSKSILAEKSAGKPALPSSVIPDGLGYNIHFTHAKPGELEMLASSGAKIIRMDFGWGGTEREKGKYDFSAFEHLTNDLEKHGIRPYYIFDYSNRHYDEGLSPYSEEGRKAFAKWAAAAAVHFKNRGIIWEMYNEPNIGFWKPEPKVEDYIALAFEVGKALREAAPDEIYIGAGTAQSPVLHTIDYPFLEECFKAGLLEYWDAISVHPYRQKAPETVAEEYAKLRYLIDKYAPKDKHIPVISGEWGYSSAWHNFNDEIQGKYLPRQWMLNLAFDVNTSIWYDWHDDGTDPKEAEHHFGTTNNEYLKDKTPVYEPKPSYIAAKTFNETFKDFKYNKRIWTGDDEVYIFLFNPSTNGADSNVKLAVWTTAKEPKEITVPTPAGKFTAVSYLGKKLSDVAANKDGLQITVSGEAVYLTPEGNNEFWSAVSALETQPLTVVGKPKQDITLPRKNEPVPYQQEFVPKGFKNIKIMQNTDCYSEAPLKVRLPLISGKELTATVENSAGVPFDGTFAVRSINAFTVRNVLLKQGETSAVVRFPLQDTPNGEYQFSVQLTDKNGTIHYSAPLRTMKVFDDFSALDNETLKKHWDILPDGDSKVGSEQKIEMENGLVKITYRFDDGWKFVRLTPKGETAKIEGKPKALVVRIDGDGSGNSVNIRYRDNKGQTFQVHGGRLTEKKPYYFEFALDGTNASHWGGANDGNIVYPIQLDSILIDGTRKSCGPYSVNIASPVLIYE